MPNRGTALSYLSKGHALLRTYGLYGTSDDAHFFALDRALSNFEKAGGYHGATEAAAALQALYEAKRLVTARSSIEGRRIILGDWFMSLAVGLALPLRHPGLIALISEELCRIGTDANRPFFRISKKAFAVTIDRCTEALCAGPVVNGQALGQRSPAGLPSHSDMNTAALEFTLTPATQRQTKEESWSEPVAAKYTFYGNKLLAALDKGYYKTAAAEVRSALAAMEIWFTSKYASKTANEMDGWIYGAIMSGGKRLRPMLTRLCASLGSARSGTPRETTEATVLSIMSTIELMHSASLVHDDIVDRSPMRRSRATINAEKGDGYAAMCGFKMIGDALELMKADSTKGIPEMIASIPMQMCEGELYQLDIENKPELQSEYEYFRRIERKTAALIEGSCVCGAIAGGADRQTTDVLTSFGRSLGLMFQLRDDLLDYENPSAPKVNAGACAAGKPVSQDMERGVYSLPLLYTKEKLAKSSPAEAFRLNAVLRKQIKTPADFRYLNEIAINTGGLAYTRKKIQEQANLAFSALALLPQGPYTEALALLVGALAFEETEQELSMKKTKIVRLPDDRS